MGWTVDTSPLHHGLGVPDGWIGTLQFGAVVSVEVATSQGTPVVASNDPIRIEHGDHLEHKQLSKHLRNVFIFTFTVLIHTTHSDAHYTCTLYTDAQYIMYMQNYDPVNTNTSALYIYICPSFFMCHPHTLIHRHTHTTYIHMHTYTHILYTHMCTHTYYIQCIGISTICHTNI